MSNKLEPLSHKTIHVIATTENGALRRAQLIRGGELPDLYPDAGAARSAINNYPLGHPYKAFMVRWPMEPGGMPSLDDVTRHE